MENKKNEKKLDKNIRAFITYLYLNKNNFLPDHKKSPNFYFDHKTIASDLQWSERKVYNILRECITRKYIDTVSSKYCPMKLSRLYHLNFFMIPDYFHFPDDDVLKSSAVRFVASQLQPKDDSVLSKRLYPNSFLSDMNYGKKFLKSLRFIDPLFDLYIDVNKRLECYKPVFASLVDTINSTNRYPCEKIFFNEKIIIDKPNVYYRIKKSVRATSRFCNSSKTLRPAIVKLLNLRYEYDIPAAVPAMFRLLNFGEFDTSKNIRQMIIDQTNLNRLITEKQLKQILYRLIFAKSFEQSHALISRQFLLRKYPDDVPNMLPHWKTLYDATHSIIGDTSMQSEIFKYESLLELRTVLALREQRYHTSNIYDCFYSEAPVDTIKNELTRQAFVLYDDFKNHRM
jgi:hypothetical protein